MSHAQRFDAVGAQKGTPLHGVVDALKRVASAVESRYDPNSREVTGAMQRFEQGLALLRTAPERPAEAAAESDDGGEEQAESGDARPTTRRKPPKAAQKEDESS